ncbi:type II toxin-antitoxin system HicA family toxin [Mesobacillus sp.]|uniref:type II toxin-antitoxin system HicA family toxin n=1 Tax=Mesobacillus sp. TaxID=2675271 RepID=UPI0039EE7395
MGMSLNRKVVISVFIVILLIILTLFFLQPKEPFPVRSISPIEAINKFKKSEKDIVLITTQNHISWYLTLKDRGKGKEDFIKIMESDGWNLDYQEGSGLFFSKENGKRIGGCKIWNRKYLVCHD